MIDKKITRKEFVMFVGSIVALLYAKAVPYGLIKKVVTKNQENDKYQSDKITETEESLTFLDSTGREILIVDKDVLG